MIGTIPTIKANLQADNRIEAKLTPQATLKVSLSVPPERETTPYTGTYEVTPSQSIQVLNTAGLKATTNIVINPIPSNYGLVTWNGSVLTVS